MGRDGEATTASSSGAERHQHKGGEEEERGGGGKLRKAFVPKHRPLPYDRPPKKDGGVASWWRSMLVDSAYRLIAGGATKFLPSFFSNDADQPTPTPTAATAEVDQDASDQGLEMLQDIQTKSSVEGGQVLLEAEVTKCGSYMDLPAGNTLHRPSVGTGISEIQQMLNGKTLSRDDLNRLTEILQSRISVPSDVDECKTRSLGATTGADAVVASLKQEILKGPEDKRVYQSRFVEESSDPFPLATSQDLLAASPVDVAKAYMGTRTTEYGVGSQSAISKEETTPLPASAFLSKSFGASPILRSSICWPGAKVEPSHSYRTPQTERHTIGLHTLPLTPVSRAVHSKSTSKLEGFGARSRNILVTNLKQSQTPVHGCSQVTRPSILSHNDGFGSAGPIRRARHKFCGTPIPPRGMSSSRPTSGVFWKERFDATTDLLPMVKQNHDSGTSTSRSTKFQHVDVKGPSSVGPSVGHPQSSDMARRILEHLDRTLPTPEKKSAELKLATSWRKTLSYESTSTGKAPVSSTLVECSENSNIRGQQLFDQEKEVKGTSLLNNQHERRKQNEATNAVSTNFSSEIYSGRIDVPLNTKLSKNEVSIWHSEHAQSDKNHSLPLQNEVGGQVLSRFIHSAAGNEAPNLRKKLSTHTFGKKPPLTSISITRPIPKNRFSFDNGSGFTFPVSVSSGSHFEPPTPSIMPSFSETSLPQTQENRTNPSDNSSLNGVPSYSFSTQTVGRTLVFSFPASSSSVQNDFSTPNFTFGSNVARISFRMEVRHKANALEVQRDSHEELVALLFGGSIFVFSMNLNVCSYLFFQCQCQWRSCLDVVIEATVCSSLSWTGF